MRIRAFPFHAGVAEFVAAHDQVFVVEQNRDAQMRTLLINEVEIDPREARARAALRRHADHRPLHRRAIADHVRRPAQGRSVPQAAP